MAIRQIRKEGDPILRKKARTVQAVDERIRLLLDDMLETMYDDNGVGLAGPQVGILRRLITVDVGEGPYKMVNPEIIERSEEEQLDVEGCLSLPNFNGTVRRPKRVTVKYLDENGEEQQREVEDLFARCVCHEIDHLDGILFRDRVEMVIDMKNPTEEMTKYLHENGLIHDEGEAQE
ncbi:MAG: peptide deformylase [Peptoniphilaceae bacterium]|nr:peptide deformylase [Peptoniphilaceae bacterium]MDY3076069.1 peptide deformylase [Peptoniphilaceae bacterium]